MYCTGALVMLVAAGEVALPGWGFCGEVEGDHSQAPAEEKLQVLNPSVGDARANEWEIV